MALTPQASAARPSRLTALGQVAVTVLLAAGFLSGLALWWGQTLQAEQGTTPTWFRPVLVLHGCLFPVQCILFGFLLCHHIRVGWQLRANLISGFAMELAFAGLIVTGAGLYYVGSEEWRERLVWAHRVLGLLVPVTLAIHWIMGLRWARRAVGRS